MSAIAPGMILLAYLCGSISSAILVCRIAGLPDPRESGSGNPGATNVLRIGGKGAAVAVLIFDVLKGMLPVWGAYALGVTPFWLGLIMILFFASTLHWLPTSGMVNLRSPATGWGHVADVMTHLTLPCATMTLIQIPQYLRITRSSVVQAMQEDYMTTFRAAGMSEGRIFRRYVLKNAILPTLTVFGISLAYVVSGAALVEIVFAWPGMGRLMLNAINRRDYPVLMGIYLMISVAVAVMTMLVDLIYAWLDPRIRLSK